MGALRFTHPTPTPVPLCEGEKGGGESQKIEIPLHSATFHLQTGVETQDLVVSSVG